MIARLPLPDDLGAHGFSVAEGRAAGLGSGRMRGADLARPFRGARVRRHHADDLRARAHALRSVLATEFVFAGVTAAELQTITDAHGLFVARVDMFFRRWKVVMEYDGDQHRSNRRQFARDRGRLDDLAAAGLRVVLVGGAEFSRAPGASVARVARALREAGWSP